MIENEIDTQSCINIPRDKFTFIPLGGATGIGMNFFAYSYKGKYLIVDCGRGFPGEGLPGVDALLASPAFIAQHKADIVALVITHAHEDHIGAIPYVWRDLNCPIYATPFAVELIEGKLDEHGLLGRVELNTVPLEAMLDLYPFQVEFISMGHSIPEPNALAITTDLGTVIHTGDWKLAVDKDFEQETNMERLTELGDNGVLALVCDSTSVSKEGVSATEMDVRRSLTDLIGQYPDRKIAIGCFASNVMRVSSIYHAAKENGRDVCLMGRSLWRIDAAARATGYFDDIPEFLSEREALSRPENSVVFICTGSQGEPFSALNTLSAFVPQKHGLHLGKDDILIFSSRVIPGNEKPIALLQKRFKTKGVKIITDKDALVHVSGHFTGEDLHKLYQAVRPHISIPVHGEACELMAHIDKAEQWGIPFAFALEEGEVLTLEENPHIIGEVPVNILALDGKRLLALGAEVIRKRRKMVDDGTFVITIVMDEDDEIIGDIKLSTFGLIEKDSEDEINLKKKIKKYIYKDKADKALKDEFIDSTIRSAIRRFLKEHYGKNPLIDVHLIRI